MGEGSAIPTDPHHTPTFIQPSTQPQKIQKPRKPKRKETQVPQPSDPTESVTDEAVHKELGDSLVRAATTASSLEAEHDSGGGPMCQETIGDTIAQTRFENVSKHSNDSLLVRGNTLQSDEDRLKLDELMALCTILQNRVLDLEKTNTTQHNEIALFFEKRGRIDAIDADEEITLNKEVAANKGNDEFNVVKEVVEVINSAKLITDATTVSAATTTTATTITVDDITLAQALMEIKSTKPKEKGVVIQELGESTTTISSQQSQDKGKGILIELVKKKDQIRRDEETALKLQAEFNEEERLARERAKKEKEANIALIETWDDI
ncbi:hypothetical protein Tco_0925438 [Tanacetum coccineum]|uniref:Uncharacterized protein n=1 Tax=Tanacetum coccineum TaxID=301880 RepID=A0ABQ5DDW3_9ASTR